MMMMMMMMMMFSSFKMTSDVIDVSSVGISVWQSVSALKGPIPPQFTLLANLWWRGVLSGNYTGPTPTRTPTSTLWMRLSCNFVNVYTRASLTDILARKSARVGKSADKSAKIVVHVWLVAS